MNSVLSYNLVLRSPVLTSGLITDPNSAASLPYLPGSALRGAIAAAYVRAHGEFDAEQNATARSLFLNGQTRFLNAYPFDVNLGIRARPTPAAWYREKYADEGDGRTYNLSMQPDHLDAKQEVSTAFVWLEDSTTIALFSPERQVTVHTQRDAVKGRALQNRGAVYRYDALAPGLPLQGIILGDREYLDVIRELLARATLWVGRARRAGYGQAEVISHNLQVEPLANWTEAGPTAGPVPMADGQLQVTLASDAILRSVDGDVNLDPCQDIEDFLGVALDTVPEHTFARAGVVGGLNGKWGLPLPHAMVVGMGSVFTYRVTEGTLDQNRLTDLEREGIGERRSEGFGRVLVNRDLERLYYRRPVYQQDLELPGEGPDQPLNQEELGLLERVQQRMLRAFLDQWLLEKTNQHRIEGTVSNSQVNRLSAQVRAAFPQPATGESIDWPRIESYLEEIRKRPAIRNQFTDTQVSFQGARVDLLMWIERRVREGKARRAEGLVPGETVRPGLAPVPAPLVGEYVLRLIEAVLHKRAREHSDS